MAETKIPDVLVVDDVPDLLRLIGLRLSAAGYAVQAADSGEAALALFDAYSDAHPRSRIVAMSFCEPRS